MGVNEMKMMDYLVIGGVAYLILMMFKKPKPPVQAEVEGFIATQEQINQASSASQLTTSMSGNAMNQSVTPSSNNLGARTPSRTLSWR